MHAARYRQRILACRSADLDAFVPWFAGGAVAGFVHRDHVALLRDDPSFRGDGAQIRLRGEDPSARSRSIAAAIDRLHAAGAVRAPLGELYPVPDPSGPPLLQLDRCAVPWFGVRARGVHLNGFVRGARLRAWIAERSRHKRTFPGHLDNMVAGGQSLGLDARQTLVKECAEEAAIPAELSASAVEVGSIDYVQQDGRTLKRDTLVCFDLELPPSFVPEPRDGEVERFELLPVAAIAGSLRSDSAWKPNSALVALDFLLRTGALDGELPAVERWQLWRLLRSGLP